jgi:hypothetical protein
MAYCTKCGSGLSGPFCSNCGNPTNAEVAPPTTEIPTTRTGNQAIVWIGAGLVSLFLGYVYLTSISMFGNPAPGFLLIIVGIAVAGRGLFFIGGRR